MGRRASELAYTVETPLATIDPSRKPVTDPAKIGLPPPCYVSAVAVDDQGHQSLPAYPELRCDGTACAVPPDALDTTAKN